MTEPRPTWVVFPQVFVDDKCILVGLLRNSMYQESGGTTDAPNFAGRIA